MNEYRANQSQAGPFLRKLVERFHRAQWILSDPVQYVHRYSRADDKEVVAFIAACFAYGSVSLILRAVGAILSPMGENPSEFIRNYEGERAWPGFYHRFHREGHVEILVSVLKKALAEFGTLGELFRQKASEVEAPPCEAALHGAAIWFREQALLEAKLRRQPELARGLRFFFNSPLEGSACKRMAMFLRWMVRKDEVDLGLWDWFDRKDLVIPADTHVARISYYLRLRGGKESQAPTWKLAREITRSLREFDQGDPVSVDFALARLGILEICKRQYVKSICERCPVEPACRFSRMRAKVKTCASP